MINISDMTCKAVFADKLINCFKVDKEKGNVFSNLTFTLNGTEEEYEDNALICVTGVYVYYDNIGLINEEINARLRGQNIELLPMSSIPVTLNDENVDNIYNDYIGVIKLESICCSPLKYYRDKIYERNISFFVDNLVITIKGTIGCKSFSASYRYSGIIS